LRGEEEGIINKARGTVEVLPEFADGLRDLDRFSHIIVLYSFHISDGYDLLTHPQKPQ